MPTVRPALWTAALLLTTLLVAGAATGGLLSSPGREPTGLQLIISPHPDDELLVWPAIEDDPTTYTAVLTLTRGEATNFCGRVQERTQTDAGEVLPDPVPTSSGTAPCARARVAAWRSFLRRAGEHTDEIRLGRTGHAVRSDDRLGGEGDFWVGDNAAHVVLSLPDGDLTKDGVVTAVDAVLASRGEILPDLPLRRILAASYWNDSPGRGQRTQASGDCTVDVPCPGDPAAYEYEHPDHRAVSLAMTTLAEQTELGAWVSVPPRGAGAQHPLGSAAGQVQTLALPRTAYERLMGLGPVGEQGPQRLGLQQQVYGWLAFPGQWWAVGEVVDTDVLFARQQSYLVLPGGSR